MSTQSDYIEKIEIASWEGFEAEIEKHRTESLTGKSNEGASPIVYRGQGDAKWPLESTLGRYCPGETVRFKDYLKQVVDLAGTIDSCVGSDWSLHLPGDVSTVKCYEDLLPQNEHCLTPEFRRRIIEYLMHMRHIGFPSPILDWTRSPYIAAFFAFSDMPKDAQNVAIYAYQEKPHGQKLEAQLAYIKAIDSDLMTHRRHYLQQSYYTIVLCCDGDRQCCTFDIQDAQQDTADVQGSIHTHISQDVIKKLILPSSKRTEFLRRLDSMNINHFSLFGDEDALAKTLAVRTFDLRGK